MFACIYIPDFPVAAIVRAEPLLRDRAIAVLEGKPPQVRVAALNDKARLLGMEAGMTKLQAAIFAVPEEGGTVAATAEPKKKSSQIEFASERTKAQPKPTAAVLRQRSLAQEGSSHAALLDVAHAFTPRVEDTHPDRLLLDLDGLERLYGSAATMARELASRLSAMGLECNVGMAANPDAAMHAACGFSGITVIPAGEEAKRLGVLPLAVLLDSFDIAHSGQAEVSSAAREREQLRERMLDTLERWGVRDFRTLALLPEHALAARLGEAGTRLQILARGAGMRTLALCEPPVHFEEAMELESAVETLEPLSFLLNRLLEQLCARLEARALAVQELQLRLRLEPRVADEQAITLEELTGTPDASPISNSSRSQVSSSRAPQSRSDGDAFVGRGATGVPAERRLCAQRGGSPCGTLLINSQAAERPTPPTRSLHDSNLYTRTLRVPVSMRDSKVFLKLLQLDLEAHPPGAPVCKLWIAAKPAHPRSTQRGLFLPITPEAEKLEITLARIAGVVGERRAGIAKLLDTHRPGAFRIERFVSRQEPGDRGCGLTLSDTADIPPLALRVFRPAREVRVQLAEGRPCKLAALTRNVDRDELQGKIVWSAGPWRSSGDWWAEQSSPKNAAEDAQPWNREEWDIALANDDGSGVVLYRIYRDADTGQWFADASYD